jgi:hypothetical protein
MRQQQQQQSTLGGCSQLPRPGSAAAARVLRVLAKAGWAGAPAGSRSTACAGDSRQQCASEQAPDTLLNTSQVSPDREPAAGSSRPTTAALQAVLAASTAGLQDDDGVAQRLLLIAQHNGDCDQTADMDIVADDCACGGAAAALVATQQTAAACSGFGSPPATPGQQQAAAMVLNLDDPAASTAEVLMLELAGLELCELQQLQQALCCQEGDDAPAGAGGCSPS